MFAVSSLVLDDFNSMVFSSHKTTKGILPSLYAFDSSSCVSIVIDTITKPHTQTYNYSAGCVGSDGKKRSGTVILSYGTQDIRQINNVISIIYQNYTIFDSITVNGEISVTNTGYNSNGNLVLTQTGTYSSVRPSEADTANVNYQYEWIAGVNNVPSSNLQFQVTGQVTGSSSLGETATYSIVTPLIKNAKTPGCNFVIQGTTRLVYGGTNIIDFDFGNPGGCSGYMNVTENGVSHTQRQ